MADQCLALEDKLFISDAVGLVIAPLPAADRLIISDAAAFGRRLGVADAASVRDAAALFATVAIGDALRVSDGVAVTSQAWGEVGDRLRAGDRALLTLHEWVAETLTVGDSALGRRAFVQADALHVGDATRAVRHADAEIRDRLTIADALLGVTAIAIGDVLHALDASTLHRTLLLSDHAEAGDGVDLAANPGMVAGDRLRIRDAVMGVLHAVELVVETALLEDAALLPTVGAAWTANTDTWAASRYSGFFLNSLAVVDGQLAGAGPMGLYLVDGESDAGSPIDASVLTDERTGGPEASLRHGGYVYAMSRNAGAMGSRVIASEKGQRQVYTYAFEDRRNDAIGPMRVKYGRGIKALTWQFEIFNKEGADFRLAGGLAWLTDPGSRRV